jgi:formiminoglutamase
MNWKNYKTTGINFWTGRVDDPTDIDSFRMHQIIQILDLRKIKQEEFQLAKLNICFIGFCCDEGIKRNLGRVGAKQGPEYIRKEFANLPVSFGNRAKIYDAGDIICVEDNMEEAQKQLELGIELLLENKLFPIVLGGGHELAFGHYNGIINYIDKQEKQPKVGIINFDAHLDLRPYDKVGSSGTMFSQIADKCKSENREFSYICLGVQTSANTLSLFKKADSLGVKYVFAKDLDENNFKNKYAEINSFIKKHEHIYVTICSDLFNSAYAPGVSAMQPFGMNPEIVLKILKKILKSNKVISLDIAEVSPRFDQDKHTAKLLAVMIYAIINTLVEMNI